MKTKSQMTCVVLVTLYLGAMLCAVDSTVAAESSSPIVINEIMANNEATILSDVGNYSDWIELYNPADYIVDISGMFLTDNLTTYMWQFPNGTTIEAQGYLLVWADANVRVDGLHTNFKLSSSGETIGLFATDGSLVDSVMFREQVADVSYGRTADGGSNWGFMIDSTPGETNAADPIILSGYPWEIWAIITAALGIICVLIFRGKILRRQSK